LAAARGRGLVADYEDVALRVVEVGDLDGGSEQFAVADPVEFGGNGG
jgi:hypothetical protein